tara:strand:+ start:1065 stop:2057 length:993 start_codon:yes stop_codon:yes gene_type:complete
MIDVHFENIRQRIIEQLDAAQTEILIAVYWFTNHHLFDKLIEKKENGLDVQLIIHNDYINNRESGLPFQQFIDVGGKFYFSDGHNPMHNKFCIIDEKTIINGSYNWTYYAERKNRENIIILHDKPELSHKFKDEFNRLKELTEEVNKISPLTKFEVDENNILRTRDYLANDIVHQAKDTNRREIVELAFEMAPENIDVQKTAFELDLTRKRRLTHSIGSSLMDDKYLIIIPKGSYIPISKSATTVTVEDNQESAHATIHFGENSKASINTQFAEMIITGLPPKPAGEARLKYLFTIDIYGNLRMEEYSLDNGQRVIINKKISALLEEMEE